ncbi:hypothetical protein M514_08725, partial [Trichuris suis]
MALLHSMDRRLSKLEVPGHGIERGNVRSHEGQNAAVVEKTRSRTNATCFICASTGHFARQCPLRRQKQNTTDELAMGLMNASLPLENGHLPYVDVLLPNGMSIRALVDTGAAATFAHENLLKHCRIPAQPFNQREFKAIDGARVRPKCTAQLELTCLGKTIGIDVLILPSSPCLLALGTDALRMLGMTVELSMKGSLVKLANDGCSNDVDLRQVPAETVLKDDSVASAMARVTYGDQLNKEQRTELEKVVKSFPQLFTKAENGTMTPHGITHRINTQAVNPIKCRPYRVSSSERKAINEQVNEMLKDGTIEKSKSPWSFPVVMVRKQDASWRFCVDYRRLNAITKRDVYPLPRMDDVLDRLGGARYFSKLDLKNGYWQIPVEPSDREKTAFVTPDGLYQFTKMPFGLSNAPASFSRLMDQALVDLKWTVCLTYMDDILVFSATFEEHLNRLRAVLDVLSRNGLRLQPTKCVVGAEKTEYLGHIIDPTGLRPLPAKVEAISSFPRPQTVRQLRRFIGMSSYYRRFIQNYAGMARPLHLLLKKTEARKWGDAQEKAFVQLKEKMKNPPILQHFHDNWCTALHCDASQDGLGAVLIQSKDGKEHVVTYLSRLLTSTERRYHSNELECLAVVWALRMVRPYVLGRKFKIVTDNSAVKWLFGRHQLNDKFGRWVMAVTEYLDDCEFVHRSGRMNVIPDALSRAPVGPEVSEAEIVEEALLCTAVCDGVSREELEILQMADLELRRIRDWLDSGLVQTEEDKRKLNVQEEFRLVDGILYRKNHDQGRPWRLAIPLNLRRNIVVSTHAPPTAGHLGVEKTVNRLRKRYWWPNIMKTAREVVLACPICQKRKVGSGKPPGLLQSIELPSKPFEVLGIDHLGPFPLTGKGNRYIIVCIDYLTKWVELMAVADTTSQKVADFLMKSIVLRHGVPKKLISDQGTAFTAEKLKTTLGKLKIEHGMASSSHPQSNGLVERVNRTLSSILAAYVNSKHANWDDFVPYAMFAINTMDQSSTKLSPFELVYGRLAVLPTDSCFPWPEQAVETYDAFKRRVQNLRALARSRCMEAQKKQKI